MINHNISKYLLSISVLRVIAVLLITNTHMNNVYPSENLAIGGFIGDVLFFFISGFGLYNNNRKSFRKWYIFRLIRIYPIVWICTITFTLLGVYNFNINTIVAQYIYPTNFHFVGSISILYVLYYIFVLGKNKKTLIKMLIITFIIWVISYIFIFDKSYYHIDAVEEWMVRFVFFEAMIFGSLFKLRIKKIELLNTNKTHFLLSLLLLISMFSYFITKIGFSRRLFSMEYQILNQFTVLILVIIVSMFFISFNELLEKYLKVAKKRIISISMMSLEVYIVQKPIIEFFENIVFPVNFIVIVTCIVLASLLLSKFNELVYNIFLKIERENKNEEYVRE